MKIKLKNKVKQNRGITLIALVVTIIVLLLLAGVSIAMITGEGGILKNAKVAREMADVADIKEQVKTDILEEQMKNNSGDISKGKLIEILKKYFEEGNIPQEDDEKWESLGSIGSLHTLPEYGDYDIEITDVYDQDFPHIPKPGDIVAVPANKDWNINKIDPTVVDDKGIVIPVPKGFDYVGGTESEGVVISDVEGDNMENSLKGNQFVWIPVNSDLKVKGMGKLMAKESTAEDFKGTDTKGRTNYEGILYDFSETGENTKSEVKTSNYGQGTNGYREPDMISDYDGEDTYLDIIKKILTDQTDKYKDKDTFKATMQEDYNEMIESVKTYGGFYVGRYEMGLEDNGGTKKAISKKGPATDASKSKTSYMWYGLYAYGKTYTNEKNSVKSSMIWGSQYDAMMNYALLGDDKDKVTAKGNSNHGLHAIDTGKTPNDKILNIFDLAGNHTEWTLEAYLIGRRVDRGGNYSVGWSADNRDITGASGTSEAVSSRLTLYIQ